MPETRTPPDLMAMLERIAIAVEGLREDLAARERPSRDARVAFLLRAVSSAVGDEPFECGGLIALASAKLSTRAALHAALDGMNARALGKLLREHRGESIDGLRIERAGRRAWRVLSFETTQTRPEFNPWRT